MSDASPDRDNAATSTTTSTTTAKSEATSEAKSEATSTGTSTSKSITNDPIYLVTAALFALLTTALPALLGQPRFLPTIQTLALATFVAVALHNRNVRAALRIMGWWLPIQFVTLTLLERTFPTQIEHAITGSFDYRAAMLGWFFAGAPYPAGVVESPVALLVESVGMVIGSLVSAGLIGIWFLVRLVNLAAYGAGAVMISLANPSHTFLVIPYWILLRAAGDSGLIVLCALPLLTYQWSPAYYWRSHRNLILISLGLVVLGVIVELFLPGVVARPPLI